MKMYTVSFTKWRRDIGEYKEAVSIPESLESYSLYGHTETYAAPLILFAIGGSEKDGFCDNWDLYIDKKGTIYSIARPGSGADGTLFGDIQYIKHLIRMGGFSDTLTEYGRAKMSA